MFSIEEVKKFTNAGSSILDALKNKLAEYNFDDEGGNIEGLKFKLNDLSFALTSVKDEDWISDGKYENSSSYYQLISYDASKIKYACSKNIINRYATVVCQEITRTGSYYTDWSYTYFEPIISTVEIAAVPEITIPEHEELIFKTL